MKNCWRPFIGVFSVLVPALVVLVVFMSGCNDSPKPAESDTLPELSLAQKLFKRVPSSETGITFRNDLVENVSNRLNLLAYNYFYNGGGVAIGDLDNDGDDDIFFTGNEVSNRLYRNDGDLRFEDVTATAGLESAKWWSTGATLADVNNDGLLDIYVCNSGPLDRPEDRRNLLYINQGNLTFVEQAEQAGLADGNYSTQAAFFDYDRDGDLDCLVLNHAVYFNMPLKQVFQELEDPAKLAAVSNNLYRNEGNGTFTRVTEEAGLLRFGYGLGVTVSDINRDGWPDFYVANDFSVPDFLYINNGDGTFTDQQKSMTRHVSWFGMGCDVADFNNDGFVDIAVVDMAADDHLRGKTLMASMDEQAFWAYVNQLGYQYQFMFNSLQLNNGNGSFSEIANLSGLAKTDWSWSAFFADLDNDGSKDYLITNGFRRYALDNDFRNELRATAQSYQGNIPTEKRKELYASMPEVKLPNLAFRNRGDITFEKTSEAWGLSEPSYSNGAAVADLDGDGDLELVINNIDDEAFVYQNLSREEEQGHFLQVKLLEGEQPAEGASVTLHFEDGSQQFQELNPTRGYQSAMPRTLHFGLGDHEQVEQLVVRWPDGSTGALSAVQADQHLEVGRDDLQEITSAEEVTKTVFQELDPSELGLTFQHKENPFDEFRQEVLLPHRQSMLGGMAAVGDVNADGLDDIYFGGAALQSSGLYLQQAGGQFKLAFSQPWTSAYQSEDQDACFFDADGDDDLDLYVVSGGGGEFQNAPQFLQDRLYLNDGKGNFQLATNALPKMLTAGLRVKPADIDGDGDLDLFVGGRNIPGKYPFPPRSYLLENQGGRFVDRTQELAPDLLEPGLVTDARFLDLNGDQQLDLLVVGEWMEPIYLANEDGTFTRKPLLSETHSGWFYSIEAADLDGDGDQDLVLGNIGLNNKFHPTKEKPLRLFCQDFDGNGTLDIVLSKDYQGRMVPVRGRECSSEQMPFIKDKFPTYRGFAEASLGDILGEEQLENALTREANDFSSMVLWNEGNQGFKPEALPMAAQIAPLNGILSGDFDQDGKTDVLVAGNMYQTEVETPRYDAGSGLLLLGTGTQTLKPTFWAESGFFAPGDVKDLEQLRIGDQPVILVTSNNGPIQLFTYGESAEHAQQ